MLVAGSPLRRCAAIFRPLALRFVVAAGLLLALVLLLLMDWLSRAA